MVTIKIRLTLCGSVAVLKLLVDIAHIIACTHGAWTSYTFVPWSASVVKSLPLHVSVNLPHCRNGISCRRSLPRCCANPSLCSGTSWSEPWASTAFVSVPCWLAQGFDLFAPYSPHPCTCTSCPPLQFGHWWALLVLVHPAFCFALPDLSWCNPFARVSNSENT